MAIRIVKDKGIVLQMNKFLLGINWKFPVKGNSFFRRSYEYDLDLAAFLIGTNGKIIHDEYFVFYNNLKSPDGSVEHGESIINCVCPEDRESVIVDLTKINPKVQEIVFTISIYGANEHGTKFGKIKESFFRIYKPGNYILGKEDYIYDLTEDISKCSSLELCRIYRSNEKWMVQALGIGHHGGLEELISKFT